MAIEESEYYYTVVNGDSLTKIADKHGLKPVRDWARKIWEESKNSELYIEADKFGKKAKRQLHIGSNHYEVYDHSRYAPSYRGYDDPHQIILYAGEKIWIPAKGERERIRHEMTDDELINGFVPEFGKRYELIFPAIKVQVFTADEKYIKDDKYTLYGYDDKGDLIYKRSLTVKEDGVDNNGIKELEFNATPRNLKYTLGVTSSADDKKRKEPLELIANTTYNRIFNSKNDVV
ncbi:MAG: LysM peptidoglycan-binding domain-containing protein [Spirochaetes bacterium]|nr:LysM peptidoglycan-binding domain-containing protein [Spirochaetota bacterium]